MQLLFGQLGAVALIGSLIQTLQTIWQVWGYSCYWLTNPAWLLESGRRFEPINWWKTSFLPTWCVTNLGGHRGSCFDCVREPVLWVPREQENCISRHVGIPCWKIAAVSGSLSFSSNFNDSLFLAPYFVQTLSDTVVRVMVALAAENQPVVLKLNKNRNSALSKIICLLQEQRRSTFVDFLSSFLFVNGLPMPEYQRILLDTAFLPDVAFIAAGSPQESFFPRVKFDSSDEARLSCHIIMEHPLDWGVWPLSDGKTNLIDVLLSHKEKPLPQTISLGKFEFNNDIMTFWFEPGLDPRLKSKKL